MAPPSFRKFDGLKFMWDGRPYDSAADRETARKEYESKNFETRLIEEEGKFLVYTRRVVKEVKVEGAPA